VYRFLLAQTQRLGGWLPFLLFFAAEPDMAKETKNEL
jgi:hypothetical protein